MFNATKPNFLRRIRIYPHVVKASYHGIGRPLGETIAYCRNLLQNGGGERADKMAEAEDGPHLLHIGNPPHEHPPSPSSIPVRIDRFGRLVLPLMAERVEYLFDALVVEPFAEDSRDVCQQHICLSIDGSTDIFADIPKGEVEGMGILPAGV